MLEHYWSRNWNSPNSHKSQFEHLGLTSLSDRIVFIDDAVLRLHTGPSQAVEIINEAVKKTGRFPVLCLDGNPHPVEQYHDELCQFFDPADFFIFHADIRKEVSVQSNVAPWPSWLFYQQQTKNYQKNHHKTYRISLLSGSSRYHRIKLFYDIRPYITDQDVIVINKIGDFFDSIPSGKLQHSQANQWWNDLPYANCKEFYDYTGTGNVSPENMNHNSHPAYQACVNITGETVADQQVLLSEKTWKAYQSGCLVINFGPAESTNALKSFGFEIWDQFDQPVSREHKTNLIIELMKRNDIEHLYQQNLPMIKHNTELFQSQLLLRKIADPAIEKLTNLLTQ
jgi:hypothetical protein